MEISKCGEHRTANDMQKACEKFLEYIDIRHKEEQQMIDIRIDTRPLHHKMNYLAIMNLYRLYVEEKEKYEKEQYEKRRRAKWKEKFELCIEEIEWSMPLQQFKLIEKNETLYINIFRNKFFRQAGLRQFIPFGCPCCHRSSKNCHCD